jgi:hypothetical protein
MSRQRRLHSAPLAVAVLLGLSLNPAWGLAETYRGEFDPCPFTPATRADVAGVGTFTASLDGATLTIHGTFSELASPATAAHLRMGLAMGVPGGVIGDLSVAHETAGTVSGSISLSPEQVAALHRNAIYIQIDDTRAPAGAIWAWIVTGQEPIGRAR